MPVSVLPPDLESRIRDYLSTSYTGEISLHAHAGKIVAATMHFKEQWRVNGPNFPRDLPLPPNDVVE